MTGLFDQVVNHLYNSISSFANKMRQHYLSYPFWRNGHESQIIVIHGKTLFHQTGPCCQKDWGPLLYYSHEVPVKSVLFPHSGVEERPAALFEFCFVCSSNSPGGLLAFSHPCMWWLAPPSSTLVLQGGGTQWVLHLIREIIRGRVSNMPKRLTHFQSFFHELL